MSANDKKLFQAVARKIFRCANIQEIIETAREVSPNPLFVTDITHRVIAITSEPGLAEHNESWRMLVEYGGVPLILTGYHDIDEIYKRSMREGRSYFDDTSDSDTGRSPMLRKTLAVNGKIVGYIDSPVYASPPDEDDIAFFDVVGELCALRMWTEHDHSDYPDSPQDYFVRDMLAGRIKDGRIIDERLRYFGMRIDPHIRIITVCRFPREGATNPREMSGIIQSLRARYHYLIVTSFGPDIKVIFSGKDKLRMAKGLPEGFEEMLERDRLKAGVSSVFSDIRLMADQSYRSKTALELGHRLHPSKTLYPYEDYAFYHLLNRLPQGTDMLCHCHSSVLMLREYDCMHGTDLMADLRAYVRNKGNAAEAASDLHIHRNTFKYRIDKIKDIMDVDFVRNEILFEITMSLHILDYAEAPDN